jgi:hypothetical protein
MKKERECVKWWKPTTLTDEGEEKSKEKFLGGEIGIFI